MDYQFYKIKELTGVSFPNPFNGVVVLLNVNIDNIENSDLRDLLMNILNAIKIKIENCLIINVNTNEVLISALVAHKDVKNIIAFGIHPDMINFKANLIPYRVLKISDKNILFSASLNDLLNNKGLKQKLWKSIKKI